MTHQLRPSFRSFLGSAAFALSPAATVVAVYILQGAPGGVIFWILSGAMCLYGLFLSVQTVFVHLQNLELNDRGVGVVSPFGASWIAWHDVSAATLRERHNPVTRTDRLVVVQAHGRSISYPLSSLTREAEQVALARFRQHTRLVVIQDRPAV